MKLTNALKAISLVLALSFAGSSFAMTPAEDREAQHKMEEASRSR